MSTEPARPQLSARENLFRVAARDWARALRMWRLWTALGMEDLSDRYRRTFLGVSWIVTSFALFIVVYITIFGHTSGVALSQYGLHVTVGFGLWSFISSSMLDGCVVYTAARGWISGESIPYPVFFLQTVFRDCLVFLLILLVMLGALLWKKDDWTPMAFWAIPGLLSYLLPALWMGAILAPICTRYRDVMHAMQTVMRVLFFATPILWLPSERGSLAIIAKYNIVTYFIDIVREPLMNNVFPTTSWEIVIAANVIGCILGFTSYALTRNRIVYWV